jgi:protein-arginine kinase activator protein McsA
MNWRGSIQPILIGVEILNSNIISSDTNEYVCEAIDCKAKARVTITVNLGDKGSISLYLCEKCRSRFSDIDNSEQGSNRSKRTLLDAILDEAKDPKKQKAGRLRQKETNSAALIAASSDNKEAILLESNGREKIHPPEDKEIKYIEDDENSHYNSKLKTMKGCRNCTVLQERNETLINKIEDYEQVIKEISQIRTADKISSEINDGIQGVAFNRNVENNPTHFDEILNINHYFSWPELQ